MKNARVLILGALLGGLTVFVWEAVSWMALPWHENTLHQLKDEGFVAQVLENNAPHSGIYVIPRSYDPQRPVKPMAFLSVYRPGMPAMGASMAVGLLRAILAAGIMTFLLLKSNAKSFVEKIRFVKTCAFFAFLVAVLPNWIWWKFSSSFIVVGMLDLLIGWGLAGVVLAKLTAKKA